MTRIEKNKGGLFRRAGGVGGRQHHNQHHPRYLCRRSTVTMMVIGIPILAVLILFYFSASSMGILYINKEQQSYVLNNGVKYHLSNRVFAAFQQQSDDEATLKLYQCDTPTSAYDPGNNRFSSLTLYKKNNPNNPNNNKNDVYTQVQESDYCPAGWPCTQVEPQRNVFEVCNGVNAKVIYRCDNDENETKKKKKKNDEHTKEDDEEHEHELELEQQQQLQLQLQRKLRQRTRKTMDADADADADADIDTGNKDGDDNGDAILLECWTSNDGRQGCCKENETCDDSGGSVVDDPDALCVL